MPPIPVPPGGRPDGRLAGLAVLLLDAPLTLTSSAASERTVIAQCHSRERPAEVAAELATLRR
jgi:hypothetical protein